MSSSIMQIGTMGCRNIRRTRPPIPAIAHPRLSCSKRSNKPPFTIKFNPKFFEGGIKPKHIHMILNPYLGDKKSFCRSLDELRPRVTSEGLPDPVSSMDWRTALIDFMLNGFKPKQDPNTQTMEINLKTGESGPIIDYDTIIAAERKLALDILLVAPPPVGTDISPILIGALENLIKKPKDALKVSLVNRLGHPEYQCRLPWPQRARLLSLATKYGEEIYVPGEAKRVHVGIKARQWLDHLLSEQIITEIPPDPQSKDPS